MLYVSVGEIEKLWEREVLYVSVGETQSCEKESALSIGRRNWKLWEREALYVSAGETEKLQPPFYKLSS